MPEREQVLAVAERFGENLRRVRRREDLTQEELAKRASLHRTAIGLLENAHRVCRADTLIQLAGAMEVPPGELLAGIAWIPAPETEGTFSFNSSPRTRQPRQLSSPAIDHAEEEEDEARTIDEP
jgi:transcriptional regulator with XRE-family HTH domain